MRSTRTFLAAVSLVLVSYAWASASPVITLSNNNSVATIDVGAQAGMENWTVDGSNQLAQQWFWYRTGSMTSEQSIDAISSPIISNPDAQDLTTTYANAQVGVSVKYSLVGGVLGSGVADMTEQITLTNPTASTIVLHFYQYSNFILGGANAPNSVTLGTNLQQKYNEAFQVMGNMNLMEKFSSDTVDSPGANFGEVALVPQTVGELNDALATTLASNPAITPNPTAGPGDVSWAFQWDLTIAPGGQVIISKDKNLNVPEPSALCLLSLGLMGLAARRQRR